MALQEPWHHTVDPFLPMQVFAAMGVPNTNTTTTQHALSFPRWNPPGNTTAGIPLDSILDYMQALAENKQPLYNHSPNFPEASYRIDATNGITVNAVQYEWTHLAARHDRWVPTHRLMELALERLEADTTNRWPQLHHVVHNGGFPLLLIHGDNRKCNDAYYWRTGTPLPVFTYAAPVTDRCRYAFPMPTYHMFLHSKESSAAWANVHAATAAQYPWHTKRRQLIWRGTLWTDLPEDAVSTRHVLLERFAATGNKNNKNNNLLLDIHTTQIMDTSTFTPYTKNDTALVAQYGGLADPLPMPDFQQYRAILDVDGLSWSSRFVTLLCFNSVVLKVEPEFVDYFHGDVQPWVHYIPVASDLRDLEEMAAYANDPANDASIQRIIANANAWCHARLVHSRLADDLLDTWSFYVDQLYNNDPQWQDRWNRAQQNGTLLHEAHSLLARDVIRMDEEQELAEESA